MKKYSQPQIPNHRSKFPPLLGFLIVTLLVLGFFASGGIFPTPFIEKAEAATLTVGPGETYTTITAAITAASNGDTIYVKNGTYTENLAIGKALTIQGESNTATIITAAAAGTIVNITSVTVTIDNLNITSSRNDNSNIVVTNENNLTVTNSKIHDISVATGAISGIKGSNYTRVENNEIYNLTTPNAGITAIGNSNHISNIAYKNNYIHDISGSSASQVITSTNNSGNVSYLYPTWNVISGNTLEDISAGYGIMTYYSYVYSTYLVVENNTLTNVANGIHLGRYLNHHNIYRYNNITCAVGGGNGIYLISDNEEIYSNIIKGCTSGISADNGGGGSADNGVYYHNILVGNTTQATDNGTGNTWYDISTNQGNYFSNHNTPDANDNGIVDTAYTITGAAAASDPYPLAISKAFFEDANSNPVTSYNSGDDLAIRARDFSLNLNSGFVETTQATITNSANGDSETFTLTETGADTGIFELKDIPTVSGETPVSGNNKIDIVVGTNTFQLTYANVYDAGDTSMATATMIVPSPAPSVVFSVTATATADASVASTTAAISILPETGSREAKFPIFYIVFSLVLLTTIYSVVKSGFW